MRRPQGDKFAGFLVGPGVHGAPRRSWRPQRRTMHSLIASAFWRLHLFHSGVDSEPLATMRRLITGPHPGRMACQQPQRGVSPKELSCQTIFKRYAWRLDRRLALARSTPRGARPSPRPDAIMRSWKWGSNVAVTVGFLDLIRLLGPGPHLPALDGRRLCPRLSPGAGDQGPHSGADRGRHGQRAETRRLAAGGP